MKTPSEITGPVNLGNPGELTMIELAEKVKEITGSRSELIYKPLPFDDPKQRQPNIAMARKILDWEPKVNIEQGLIKTIQYFESLLT